MDNNLKTFTIVDTETQRTKEIKSNATIVAELKRDLRQNGFNVEGKTIQEALTRTEFKDDSSVLPHDVPYKGQITNDLVFRLTKTNKQVKSGMDRPTAYAKIKELGLADAVKAKYGKNFTQVSTNDLVSFIEGNQVKSCKKAEPKKAEPKPAQKPAKEECKCMEALRRLCNVLVERDCIDDEDINDIFGPSEVESADPEKGSRYDKDELDEILRGL